MKMLWKIVKAIIAALVIAEAVWATIMYNKESKKYLRAEDLLIKGKCMYERLWGVYSNLADAHSNKAMYEYRENLYNNFIDDYSKWLEE